MRVGEARPAGSGAASTAERTGCPGCCRAGSDAWEPPFLPPGTTGSTAEACAEKRPPGWTPMAFESREETSRTSHRPPQRRPTTLEHKKKHTNILI
ncbi:hypothetical protein FH063_003839 [Azospirillum argentinense]|uniref:Uncharacterized protein n=1 Tax=Azospirillum argentinense TaxID=2970906 RepID=A0A5B0KYP3_9PROT|nr:hypothetical protein FH063_003839 [Azospirillum argentinense]